MRTSNGWTGRGIARATAAAALALGSLVGALVGARTAGAADAPAAAPPTEAAFLAELDRAKANLSAGKPADARKVLLDALERHRATDHVFAKLLTVEDLAGRIAFRATVPPPEPQTVVKGKLKKFLSFSGLVEIVYEAGKPTDLEARPDGSLLFPVRFRGPYTVTIKGDAYADDPKKVPLLQLGMDAQGRAKLDDAWLVSFGVPPFTDGAQKAWLPPRILRIAGDAKTVVAEKTDAHPAQARRPFRLEATMSATRVAASVNGTVIGGAEKPDGVFGFVLILVPGWREITISGQIEPSWIQGRLDEIVAAKRKAFDATFDVRSVLPAWLYAPRATTAAPASRHEGLGGSILALPPELMLPYAEALEKVDDDPKAALEAAEALRAKGATAEAVGLLTARALEALGEPTKALAEVDKVLAAAPDAFDALLERAGLLVRLGRDTDLTLTLQALLRRPEAGAATYVAAGRFLLLAGRLDEARRLSEDAARRGERSEALEQLGRIVVRAQAGPAWPRAFEYKSSNYHVVSDIDLDTCRKAALVLEDALADFRGHVRSLKPEPRRLYRVYLFSGRASFQDYVEDALAFAGKAPEQVAGLYSPVLKQLLIWNLPDRDEMMKTVRHEGFHQYLDRLLPDPPVWFNEGLAVYFEDMKRVNGELKTDAVRRDFVQLLAGKPLVPMADFARIRPGDFYRTSPHSYAQGWLVAHLLRHGTPRHKELYRTLLSRLETAAGTEAVRSTFDEATLKALDADLKAHLDALRAR